MAVDGLLGLDANRNHKVGDKGANRIPGTIYFTDIDASGNISSSVGGDLTGTLPNPSVVKIQGRSVQDHDPLDTEVLTWVNANTQWEPKAAGGLVAHDLGGVYHNVDTLAHLNSKVSDANLDDSGSSRTPTAHRTTHGSGQSDGFLASDMLEAVVKRLQESSGPTNMTLGVVADGKYFKRSGAGIVGDTPSASGAASGDLSGTYPSPSVAKIRGYTMQTGAPAARDFWLYSGSQWEHHEEHLWNKTHDQTLNNATSIDLVGLDGNTQRVIKVVFYGYWNTNGADRHMYLRINNDAGANYGAYWHEHGWHGGSDHTASASAYGAPGTNSRIGFNGWSKRCDITCELTIYSEVINTRIRQAHSRFMWIENGGVDITSLLEDIMINYKNVATNITSVQLYFNGGGAATFSGRVQAFSLRKKF